MIENNSSDSSDLPAQTVPWGRFEPFTICCGGRLVRFDRPAIMGILNATPDSFYDGGRYRTDKQILDRAAQILDEGAGIIDIGVVSSRPGAQLLSPDDEAARLAAVVAAVRREHPEALISVDTCFALPARAAVDAGADIVNDIGGGDFDGDMFRTVAELHVPYVLMHNPYGSPSDPAGVNGLRGKLPLCLPDVAYYLSSRLDTLYRLGVRDVIVDPGFGFSKSLDDNYELFFCLPHLRKLFSRCPLLVAVSRKSMVFKLLGTTPDGALVGTVALQAAALAAGASMLRVHDVLAAVQTAAVIFKVQNPSM